jgi:hypothetical protein
MPPLTPKMALGAFLGIIFAFLLINVLPRRWAEWRMSRAQRVFDTLTPKIAVARCGEPIKEIADRDMAYQGAAIDGHQYVAVVSFGKTGKNWFVSGFHIGMDVGIDRALVEENNPIQRLKILPCLDK